MITAENFVRELLNNGLGPFIEVPCSLLKPVIDFILDRGIHLETPANEAVAMGLAAGHYLATGRIPVVMMQNSGLCNALNALTSLHGIYEIPVVLIITWRGEPKTKDAPEHSIIGAKLEDLLRVLDVPYKILTEDGYKREIKEMVEKARETKKHVALVLRRGMIQPYATTKEELDFPLSLFDALKIIKEVIGKRAIYVSTTGFISRLSFKAGDYSDFYMVGSMGHALPVGLGVALESNKKVVVLDGDGSILMHAGAMASVSASRAKNLIHIVLDNQAHGSTGNQPSLSSHVDFSKIAEGFYYANVASVVTESELRKAAKDALTKDGPTFIHVKINRKTPDESEMPRVSDFHTCPEIKKRFMKNFQITQSF